MVSFGNTPVTQDVTWTKSTDGNDIIYDICWTPKLPVPIFGNYVQYPQILQSDIIDSKFQLKIEIYDNIRFFKTIKIFFLSKYYKHINLCQITYLNKNYNAINKEVLLDNWTYLDQIIVKSQSELNIVRQLDVHFNVTDFKPNSFMVETGTPLHVDLESLMKNETFSDVTMKSIEGKEYKVHKVLLAARSDVLKANFEHNTTECLTNIIETPFESEVLQGLITFIYTDAPSNLDNIPEKLLVAADYYQITRLKSLCEITIIKTLNVENAIEILLLAEKYSANSLKQSIMELIKGVSLKSILKTEGWKNLNSIELIKTILDCVFLEE